MKKSISIRALNPTPGIFHGWEEWVRIEYSVNPVGSKQLYRVTAFILQDREANTRCGKVPMEPKPAPTLADFLQLNAHLLDNEIAKRVLKAAGQKPDAPLKRPDFSKGEGTMELEGPPV